MGKIFTPFLFISLIFLITISSIPFLGNSLNKQNNGDNTEQTINIEEQLKSAFVFNHKMQIEEIKQNKEEIINRNIKNMNFSQIKSWLNNNQDLILWNYYAYYEENEYLKNTYSLTSYMLVYINQDLHLLLKYIVDFLIRINYCLISEENNENKIEISRVFVPENIDELKNIEIIKININTKKNNLNSYIYKHFFIFKYKLKNIKKNDISNHYYLAKESFLEINVRIRNGRDIQIDFSSFKKSINSFNLSYENNFYLNNPKIIINNFVFLNNNITKINLNVLLPEKIKIEEFLNNLKIYADYRSYNNNEYENNYLLNFDYNYYKYEVKSNWYNVTIYINNFSEKEGIIYYNFSFFYNNKKIFLNEWVDNYKIITPIKPPQIENIYYKKNEYYENSFYIYIKYNKKINYQLANNIILYYKNNDEEKDESLFLKNPIYLKNLDIYKYELTFNESGNFSSFIFINSGYFEYDYFNNLFIKNYENNKNYLSTTGYKYFFKKLNIEINSNKLNINVIDSKIIKKGNKYYLDVLYHSNKIWNISKNGNINLIKKINFNYSSYNEKNNKFKKYSKILYISKINFINYKNNIEALYEIPTFEENSIYINLNFSLEKWNNKYNEIYFLSQKIYITNFSEKNITNIKTKKIKSNSISFDITYSDINEIQANNLKITYKDSNGNNFNSLKENNLINNGIVNSDKNEITYEYTLVNLENNTEYNSFNIYLLNELYVDYKYDWSYLYFNNSIYPEKYKNESIKTKNKILIIFLSLIVLSLYTFTFLFFIIKYKKYKKNIL